MARHDEYEHEAMPSGGRMVGGSRERDLVLANNQYAFIQNLTKGDVSVYVGPTKVSLDQNDIPVVMNETTGEFVQVELQQAIKLWPIADENSYIRLVNPTKEVGKKPTTGQNTTPELNYGRAVNVSGPTTFAPYPGQVATVIKGHELRTDQYLNVKVTNADAAKEAWGKLVVAPKKQEAETTDGGDEGNNGSQPSGQTPTKTSNAPPQKEGKITEIRPGQETPLLSNGQLLIVKGTTTELFMPVTGLEVLKDASGNYVRDAVSLESLEWCLKLDQDGTKAYEKGPQVVYLSPTQEYVLGPNGERKFKALELNPEMGIHIKVLAPYNDDGSPVNNPDDAGHKEGDEIWITGKTDKIYWPRPEHSIIKRGGEQIHYAVMVAKGRGRYLLNKETGDVELVLGPAVLLPDPRKYRFVKRPLPDSKVRLWFPKNSTGSHEANKQMREKSGGMDYLVDDGLRSMSYAKTLGGAELTRGMRESVADFSSGDEITRKAKFTKPQAIDLSDDFEGAIPIRVYTGWAVKVVDSQGKTDVVVGPVTRVLQFDEDLEVISLSAGTPKGTEPAIQDVYLRVSNNQVSDVIVATTKDMQTLQIPVKYRVNFRMEYREQWFDVEDYVKLLTDHLRSLVRAFVQRHNVDEFMDNHIDIIRDAVLGAAGSGNDGKGRLGKLFIENGMHIYDMEVAEPIFEDREIEKALVGARHSSMKQTLELKQLEERLAFTKKAETIKQQMAAEGEKTAVQQHELDLAAKARGQEAEMKAIAATRERNDAKLDAQKADLTGQQELKMAEVAADLELQEMQLDGKISREDAELKARIVREGAVAEAKLDEEAKVLAAKLAGQEKEDQIHAAVLGRRIKDADQVEAVEKAKLARELERLVAEVKAAVDKAKAIDPEVYKTLEVFSQNALAAEVAQGMAPLSILGGKNVVDFITKALDGTPLADTFRKLGNRRD